MSKQTAAEKFDLLPPWCVVKQANAPSVDGRRRWYVHHASNHAECACSDGSWFTSEGPYGYITSEPEARRIARLTRPLPSWEPAPDSPLPVEGWIVAQCAVTSDWCIIDGRGTVVRSGIATRAAAYVWAWTEAEHTDGTGATDGHKCQPGCKCDGRGELGWEAFDELCETVDQCEVKIEDTAKAVDGIIARIGPMESFIAEAQALANRMTIVERLVAAQVAKPATLDKPHAAASANDFATAVAGADEGWREKLVTKGYDGGSWGMWLYDPTGNWWWNTSCKCWRTPEQCDERIACKDSGDTAEVRRTCPPPPNLAEWWKPGVKEVPVTAGELAARMVLIKQAENAVPPTYRVGDDVAAWVRNLASAHDTALKDMAEYRTQLATAQTAATAAEGRADTAKKRASEAEEALANVRLRLANAADALGHVSRCSTGCESCRRFAMGAKSRAES